MDGRRVDSPVPQDPVSREPSDPAPEHSALGDRRLEQGQRPVVRVHVGADAEGQRQVRRGVTEVDLREDRDVTSAQDVEYDVPQIRVLPPPPPRPRGA